jgi:cation diffusion facilitator family transporter
MSPEGSSITSKVRHRAVTLALAATVGLTALKLAVGWLSGSVGVVSEGIHSSLDLVSAGLSFFTVREAVKPADEDHPFGHGKLETLSSLFESLLLVLAAVWIMYEGAQHLVRAEPVKYQGLAILTIVVSMAVSYFMYRHNLEASQLAESSAIQVNALHFLSDVVASGGVLVALVLMKLTGWQIIDPLIAFGVAVYILMISVQQVKSALGELADRMLPEAEVRQIQGILDSFRGRALEAHDLRTRKSGKVRHIDFHLVVCGHLTVNESHAVCDEMEEAINRAYPGSSVNIHVEPCEHHGPGCERVCDYRENALKGKVK